MIQIFLSCLGPSVTTQGRSRRDSDQSSHSNEVFSGGEEHKDEPYSQQAPISPPIKEETPVKLVPAPPPKENIWEKRRTQQTPPSQKQEEYGSPQATKTVSESPSSPATRTGSQSEESSPSTKESHSQSTPKPQAQSQSNKPKSLSQNEVCIAQNDK